MGWDGKKNEICINLVILLILKINLFDFSVYYGVRLVMVLVLVLYIVFYNGSFRRILDLFLGYFRFFFFLVKLGVLGF